MHNVHEECNTNMTISNVHFVCHKNVDFFSHDIDGGQS